MVSQRSLSHLLLLWSCLATRLVVQANDIPGTVPGCANALLEADRNKDGLVKQNEFWEFVNVLSGLLCVPPRENLDLDIQTTFISISCLCQRKPGAG